MAALLGFAAQDKKPNAIKLGMSFTPNPREEDLAMLRHNGVDAVSIWAPSDMATAEWMIAIKKKLEANGAGVYQPRPHRSALRSHDHPGDEGTGHLCPHREHCDMTALGGAKANPKGTRPDSFSLEA